MPWYKCNTQQNACQSTEKKYKTKKSDFKFRSVKNSAIKTDNVIDDFLLRFKVFMTIHEIF